MSGAAPRAAPACAPRRAAPPLTACRPARPRPPRSVPLASVKSPVLAKIVEFCKHHVDEPLPAIEKPLRSSVMAEIVPEWDAAFVNIEEELLFEIILAANYMDIKPLLDLTCAKVAANIRGKTRVRAGTRARARRRARARAGARRRRC